MLNPLIENKKISGALVIAVPSGKHRYTPFNGKAVFVLACPGLPKVHFINLQLERISGVVGVHAQ